MCKTYTNRDLPAQPLRDAERMKSLDEIREEIRTLLTTQIRVRQDLVSRMVGTLYPQVVVQEITELRSFLANK